MSQLRIVWIAIGLFLVVSLGLHGQNPYGELYPKRYSDGTYGYVNRAGSFMISPKYHKAYPFFDGYARVQMYGNWGLIDERGELVLKTKYEYIGWSDDPFFQQNKGWLHVANSKRVPGLNFHPPYNGKIGVLENGKWSVRNLNGSGKSKTFDSLNHFEGGFAPVYVQENQGWTFIDDQKFNIQVEQSYRFVFPLSCGLVGLRSIENNFEVYNPASETFLPDKFVDIASLTENLFSAKSGNGWGVVNLQGEHLSNLEYRKITYLPFIKKVKLIPKNQWMIYNPSWDELFKGQLDSCYFLENGFLIKLNTQGSEYLDKSLRLVGTLDPNYWARMESDFWLLGHQKKKFLCPDFPNDKSSCKPFVGDLIFREDFIFLRSTNGELVRYDKDLNPLNAFPQGTSGPFHTMLSVPTHGGTQLFDIHGKKLSDSIYDKVLNEEKGLALVVKGGKKGVVDSSGKEIVSPTTNYFTILKGQSIAFYLEDKIRLVDRDSLNEKILYGESIFPNGPDLSSKSFSLNLRNGKKLLDNEFEPILGNRLISISQEAENGYISLHSKAGWAVYDLNSNEFFIPFSPDYDSLGLWNDGLIPVWINGNRGFLGENKALVISTQYEDLGMPKDGIFPFMLKGGWGLFDKSEKIILQPRYQSLKYLGEGLWRIQKEGNVGLFDVSKGIILDPVLTDLKKIHGSNWLIAEKDGFQGLFDKNGDQKLSTVYDKIEPVGDFGFILKRDNDWEVLDKDFKKISPFRLSFAASNAENLLIVQKKEEPVLLDVNGN